MLAKVRFIPARSWLKLCLSLAALLCLTGLPIRSWAGKIAVVISRNLDMYRVALEGFRNSAQGEYEIYNIDTDCDVLKNLAASSTQLAVIIGSDALKANAFLKPEIPVCYSMVLQAPENEGRRMFGTVLKVNLGDQMLRLRRMFPGRKRVSILYHPRYSGQDVALAADMANHYGLNLNAVAVDALDKIPEALRKMTADRTDLLWMLIDEFLANPAAVKYVVQHAWKESLPTIGYSSNQVKAGFLAAFSPDYFDVGSQTAELAAKYLSGNQKPGSAPPRKIVIFLNLRVQNKLKMEYLAEFPNIQYVQ